MKEVEVIGALAALAHPVRLKVFRALVVSGPQGLTPGVMQDGLGVPAATLSFHLKELERSGLITQQRESRSIIYTANYEALGGLIRFLMEDCCSGNPQICAPAAAVAACCAPATKEELQ